jgi:cholesterol transport system auxiliary component
MMPPRPPLAGLLAALCCLVLGSCAALQLATRDPPQLYALTPKSSFAADLPKVDARLSVEVPTATGGLNTPRIALKPTPTMLEYYAGGAWVDVLPVMVQSLLLESLDNSGTIDVIGREVVGVRANYALLTHIREFQAEYEGSDPPQVRVRLQARLIELPRRTSLSATSVESVIRSENTSLPAIVRAFDEAFGKVTKRLVEWTLEELSRAGTPAT